MSGSRSAGLLSVHFKDNTAVAANVPPAIVAAASASSAIHPLVAADGEANEAISHAITGPRAAGYSWAEIAVGLGVARQAAQQRWGQ